MRLSQVGTTIGKYNGLQFRDERLNGVQKLRITIEGSLRLALFFLAFGVSATSPAQVAEGLAPWVGVSLDGAPCQGGKSQRPRDYLKRASMMHHLEKNERFHFTPNVEQLISGQSGRIPADIDFMLNAWPNHHRVLNSITRYELRRTRGQLKPEKPVECYFQRAINFSPGDSVSMMLYGIYLQKSGYSEKALEQYRSAEEISPTDPQIQYNLALCLVELERYEEALKYAQGLYGNGFPLPGLKRKLLESGYWADAAGASTK